MQGLRFLPLWLVFIGRRWLDLLPNDRPAFIHDYAMIAGVLFILLWFWLCGRWYKNRFGYVKARISEFHVWVPLIAFCALVMHGLMFRLDGGNLPISFVALWWACLFGWQTYVSKSHHIRMAYYGIGCASMLLASFIPMTGWIPANRLLVENRYLGHPFPIAYVFIGIYLIFTSVFDHCFLVRQFSKIREQVNA
jgi:hypothetical protein